ncbi:MAG TPA: ECF transporter S component [Firmicutes bacterium]|nr:ECF transporter S component [Bacillota bacterium]
MKQFSSTRFIALSAMFSALVFVLTAFARVPALGGKLYFHLGGIAIYCSAVLFGPAVGGTAGAVGSALADLMLGVPVWAPISFMVHGAEGLLVGRLSNGEARIGAMAAGAAVMVCGYGVTAWMLYGVAAVPIELVGDVLQGALGIAGAYAVLRGLRNAKR